MPERKAAGMQGPPKKLKAGFSWVPEEARLLHDGRCFLDASLVLSFFFFFLSFEISDGFTLLFLDSELTSFRSALTFLLLLVGFDLSTTDVFSVTPGIEVSWAFMFKGSIAMELRFEDRPLVSRLSPAPIAFPITWTNGDLAALLGFGAAFFWSCACPSLLEGAYTLVSLGRAVGFFDLAAAPALLFASLSYASFSAFCRFSSSALYFFSLFCTSGQLGCPQ